MEAQRRGGPPKTGVGSRGGWMPRPVLWASWWLGLWCCPGPQGPMISREWPRHTESPPHPRAEAPGSKAQRSHFPTAANRQSDADGRGPWPCSVVAWGDMQTGGGPGGIQAELVIDTRGKELKTELSEK